MWLTTKNFFPLIRYLSYTCTWGAFLFVCAWGVWSQERWIPCTCTFPERLWVISRMLLHIFGGDTWYHFDWANLMDDCFQYLVHYFSSHTHMVANTHRGWSLGEGIFPIGVTWVAWGSHILHWWFYGQSMWFGKHTDTFLATTKGYIDASIMHNITLELHLSHLSRTSVRELIHCTTV